MPSACRDDERDVLQLSGEHFLGEMRVNALGPMLLVRAVLDRLRAASRPRIVNISSQVGSMEIGRTVGRDVGYTSSKAALNMITLKLASRLREDGIVAISLHPGFLRTDMNPGRGDMERGRGRRARSSSWSDASTSTSPGRSSAGTARSIPGSAASALALGADEGPAGRPGEGRLQLRADPHEHVLPPVAGDELDAARQPVLRPAERQRQGRLAGDVERPGEGRCPGRRVYPCL